MFDKKQVLAAIATIAKKLGRPPSRAEFNARSGISPYFVLQWFRSWSDALLAAGLPPYTLNAKVKDRALLEDWGKTARKNRGVLPRHIYLREGEYSPGTLAKRFGGWSSVPEAFRKFAKGKREWAEVLALLPTALPKKKKGRSKEGPSSLIRRSKAAHSWLTDRVMYGNPLDFPGLRHEPVNEQGVVLLFGMLARELGYIIEAAQHGFPDCEAKRRIAPGRWQRVRIEFEFESKNFWEHGHAVSGCDVIVCWRHNWDECPKSIEVVELSSLIKSLDQMTSAAACTA